MSDYLFEGLVTGVPFESKQAGIDMYNMLFGVSHTTTQSYSMLRRIGGNMAGLPPQEPQIA